MYKTTKVTESEDINVVHESDKREKIKIES